MSYRKDSKKNGIKKLRILLDDKSMKKLNLEDEKYLITLKQRLNESSDSKIVIKKILESPEKEEYSLKPNIVIHTKKREIKPTPKIIHEEESMQSESEPIFQEVFEGKVIDDDLIEIEKIEIKLPEFIEVKPKTDKKLESIKIIEEETEELTEWEPVTKKKEQVVEKESIKLKKQDTSEEESIPYFIPVEKSEEIKDDNDLKQEKSQYFLNEPEINKIISIESTIKEDTIETKKSQIEKLAELDFEIEKKKEAFKDIESIDEDTAVLLYDNGYTYIDSLKNATVKDLKKIKGINKKKAKNIIFEIEKRFKDIEFDKSLFEESNVEYFEEKLDENLKEPDQNIQKYIQREKQDFFEIERELISKEEIIQQKEENIKELTKTLNEKNQEIEEKQISIQNLKEEIKEIKIENKNLKGNLNQSNEELKTNILQLDERKKELQKIKTELEEKKQNLQDIKKQNTQLEKELKEQKKNIKKKEDHELKKFKKELNHKAKELTNTTNKLEKLKAKYESQQNDYKKSSDQIKTLEKELNKKLKDINLKNKELNQKEKDLKAIKKEKKELELNINKIKDEESPEYIKEVLYKKHEDNQIEELTEWESIENKNIIKNPRIIYGYMYNGYILYEKEIITKSGNKRLIRFFSKGEPENSKPINIPDGYEVNENKSGVPYISKIKN